MEIINNFTQTGFLDNFSALHSFKHLLILKHVLYEGSTPVFSYIILLINVLVYVVPLTKFTLK